MNKKTTNKSYNYKLKISLKKHRHEHGVKRDTNQKFNTKKKEKNKYASRFLGVLRLPLILLL